VSHLYIYDYKSREFKMNVTQFRSPMNASITSAQTAKMMHHFPIRCGQPDINFTVQYKSLEDKHEFESWVREHQQKSRMEKNSELTLWWPERNIDNWTGYITSYTVNEKRFEVAPSATFGVMLVDSMMSEKTTLGSRGFGDIMKIIGDLIAPYRGYRDDILLVQPNFTNTTQPVNPQDSTLIQPPAILPTAPPAVGR
jgi:hypothetical protein